MYQVPLPLHYIKYLKINKISCLNFHKVYNHIIINIIKAAYMTKIFRNFLSLSVLYIIFPLNLNATPLEDGVQAFKDKDYKAAISHFKKSAEEGESAAQDILGNAYYNGHMGLKKDLKEAAKYWKMAADQDHPASQTNLGLMYLSGIGIEKDIELAQIYLERGSKSGNLLAMTNLGILYMQNGHNFEGMFRIIMAAKAQNPTAKTALLSMGITVTPPLPGESMASQDVVDVMVPKLVALAQKEVGDSCDGNIAKVIDSKILGKPDKVKIDNKIYYQMNEEWLIDICDQKVPITTKFHTQIKSINEHLDENGLPIDADRDFSQDHF